MRDVTPPPVTRRVRTPPAPRHGGLDDEWNPYSPRRSSRVAAQRTKAPTQRRLSDAKSTAVTQISSPPSSPRSRSPSLSQSTTSRRLVKVSKTTTTTRQRKQRQISHCSSATDVVDTSPPKKAKVSTAMDSFFVIPTPEKTPHKKSISKEELKALNASARRAFPPRYDNPEDAMPVPKKRGRKNKGYSLNPFVDENMDDGIEVYEDSNARIPDRRFPEANPFLMQPGEQAVAPAVKRTPQYIINEHGEQMDVAPGNDEGIVYVFRGKKIFRRYEEAADGSDDDYDMSDLETRRRGRIPKPKRLTRSNVKPRLLFLTEEQRLAREAAMAEEADEETVGDLDVPEPIARRLAISINHDTPLHSVPAEMPVTTPVDEMMQTPSTPPPSHRATRSGGKQDASSSGPSTGSTDQFTNKHLSYPKKGRHTSPFTSWARTKSSTDLSSAAAVDSNSKGTKREGSPVERSVGAKRTRSGAHFVL